MRLSDVARLQVGDRITLAAQPGAPVKIRCGAVPLFEGRLGQRKSRVAVRLDSELTRPQEPSE